MYIECTNTQFNFTPNVTKGCSKEHEPRGEGGGHHEDGRWAGQAG